MFSSSWIGGFPSPRTNESTPPITPRTLDSSFFGTSNTSTSFLDHSSGLALHLPFTSDPGTTSISPIPLIPLKRLSNDMQDIEACASNGLIPHQRQPKFQHQCSLVTILRDLQELRLTAVDLLVAVINGNGEFKTFRNTLFSLKNRTSLVGLLNTLVQDKKGHPIVSDWMLLHALGLVCDKIHTEMEAAKPCLWMNTGDVSPEFIEHWDIHKVMGLVANDITPTLTSILDAAGESTVRPCALSLSLQNQRTSIQRHLFSWHKSTSCAPGTLQRCQLDLVYKLGHVVHQDR